MSICPNPEEYSAYIDGELSEDLEKDLIAHLEVCKECRSVVQDFLNIKNVLALEEIPEFDMEHSFECLLKKRNTKRLKLSYAFLALLRKRYAIAGVSLAIFFVLVFFYLATPKYYILHPNFFTQKRGKEFTPIVPVAYRANNRIHFDNLSLAEMHMFAGMPKKSNTKICSNFTNTFNNFSNLYSQLNGDDSFKTMKTLRFNSAPFYQYASSMPIYANLNKDAK